MTSDPARNLWHLTCRETVAAPPLTGAETADLLVIGGGFTGVAAALRAAELGARVRLLEAREIGHGGSGRNVGLVNAGLWLPPEDIVAVLGAEPGARLVRILGDAPDLVFSLIAKHAIDCEAVRNGTLHCAHAPAGLGDLRIRHRQMAACGAPVTLLSREETAARTGSQAFFGALHDARAGTVQPLALCRGLARVAVAAGAALHARSPVTALRFEGGAWLAETPMGEVCAGALLVATNAYHLAARGLAEPEAVPMHFFQMATEPIATDLRGSVLSGGEGCWDTAKVMSSLRTDRAGRLIIGAIGALDHPGARLHRDWARRKLRHLFPALAGSPLQQAWHGRIAMTTDHVPKILRLGGPGYTCFGYSGRGIGPGVTFGTRAAEALLSGDENRLPVVAQRAHREGLRSLRGAGYEAGATLTHALGCRF